MDATPILWHSNAPWVGTGYGQQTRLFVPRLASAGYRPAYSAFFGLKGCTMPFGDPPLPVYPGHRDVYGNDVLLSHYIEHVGEGNKGLLVTLTDPWVLDPALIEKLPSLVWTPVDADPLIPMTKKWMKDSECVPLAMSRFGERVMKEAKLDPLYCPHGYDAEIFRPIPREQARKLLKIPQGIFLVGMVSANIGTPSRKNFSGAIQAFARFRDELKLPPFREPRLYLHTQMLDPEGEDLQALCEACGVRPLITGQYQYAKGLPSAHVSVLLNAFDVLLCPSIGEGFGVPLLEANACGTPVITTDWSANPEVADPSAGNIAVSGDKFWSPFDAWHMYPTVQGLTDALHLIHEEGRDRDPLVENARRYEIGRVMEEYMLPAIQEASARCFPK